MDSFKNRQSAPLFCTRRPVAKEAAILDTRATVTTDRGNAKKGDKLRSFSGEPEGFYSLFFDFIDQHL